MERKTLLPFIPFILSSATISHVSVAQVRMYECVRVLSTLNNHLILSTHMRKGLRSDWTYYLSLRHITELNFFPLDLSSRGPNLPHVFGSELEILD